ncbi:Exodeoxyribonuclease 7 large subunit [Gossypium arboreum]|uniref:Exodeoxyribonuclease 7 large subunit n=1 Tax=Gossypium arboreum TaxID=29729 RepID=A0A0B0N3H5_GOSAR|nr:Exodeoxyribonuclease 7 large subunit [Gossypium arboreum]
MPYLHISISSKIPIGNWIVLCVSLTLFEMIELSNLYKTWKRNKVSFIA